MINLAIAVVLGAVVGTVGVIGGGAAIQGHPHGVPQSSLYSYADR